MKKPIQFGKYWLLDRINVGGMAEVWKAKAFGVEGFERLLAVKRILPNIAEDEEFVTMFIDEAKIAVQLSHANICQIFDLGRAEGSFFIALEFVHGKDLRALYDRCRTLGPEHGDGSQAMSIAQACFIIMKACEGLDYAHNRRDQQGAELHIVHRDVSPQNILISYDGEVKLIDFGIAKAAGKAGKTQQGILKGKFGYMSPEQVRGLPLDRRSDIFSIGIVLYELLTGERLFVGESDFATLEKVRNGEILPPSTYNRRISDELERIVMKALAKDVDDRYQNAIDLHDDLQAFIYTAGEFYSRKDLAAWMKRVWAREIEEESAKLEQYRDLPAVAPSVQQPLPGVQTAPERVRRSSGPVAIVPPPIPAPPTRRSGPHAVVPSSTPAPATAAGGPSEAMGANGDLAWDEEELATNIYGGPAEAADEMLLSPKGDFSQLEVNSDGAPVPHPSVAAGAELEGRRNGAGWRNPFDYVPDEPVAPMELPPPALEPLRGEPGARRPPRPIGLFVVGTLSVAAACVAAAAALIYYNGRPGRLVIASEPASNVQVLLDNKRQAISGTPATLTLEPGRYALTVQREGYVPWSQEVEVKPGDTTRKQVALEPMASGTGFTLVSEPAGAQALLDDRLLDGVTPLKVQAVMPGKHRIEVRSGTASWSQEVTIEAGKMLDVRCALAAASQRAGRAAPHGTSTTASDSKTSSSAPKLASRDSAAKLQLGSTDDSAGKEGARDPAEATGKPRARGAARSSGYLRLGSKPWTNILVDGKDSGMHTPQTRMKLAAGPHRITLTNPRFGINETFSVEIKPGATETVIKDLSALATPPTAD